MQLQMIFKMVNYVKHLEKNKQSKAKHHERSQGIWEKTEKHAWLRGPTEKDQRKLY